MNKIVKNTLILTAITVVAGLLLGVGIWCDKRSDRESTGRRQNRKHFVLFFADAETFEIEIQNLMLMQLPLF